MVVLEPGSKSGDALGEPESLGPGGGSGKGLIADSPVSDLSDLGIGEGSARVDAEINGAQESGEGVDLRSALDRHLLPR